MIGVGQKPSCWHSAVHRIKQRLLLLFDQIYWWRLGGTASRCSMNSRWTAGISTVRVDINLIHKTPLWLCLEGLIAEINALSLHQNLSPIFHFDLWGICTRIAAFWGRLQKERASAKAPPSRPVHKELQIFFVGVFHVSHGFFCCENQEPREHRHKSMLPHHPLYQVRWNEPVSDWRPRFQSTEGKFDKVNIFCLGCYPSNHRPHDNSPQVEQVWWPMRGRRVPFDASSWGKAWYNAKVFLKMPKIKTLRVKWDVYIVAHCWIFSWSI